MLELIARIADEHGVTVVLSAPGGSSAPRWASVGGTRAGSPAWLVVAERELLDLWTGGSGALLIVAYTLFAGAVECVVRAAGEGGGVPGSGPGLVRRELDVTDISAHCERRWCRVHDAHNRCAGSAGCFRMLVVASTLDGLPEATAQRHGLSGRVNQALNFLEQREAVGLTLQVAVAVGALLALLAAADALDPAPLDRLSQRFGRHRGRDDPRGGRTQQPPTPYPRLPKPSCLVG